MFLKGVNFSLLTKEKAERMNLSLNQQVTFSILVRHLIVEPLNYFLVQRRSLAFRRCHFALKKAVVAWQGKAGAEAHFLFA